MNAERTLKLEDSVLVCVDAALDANTRAIALFPHEVLVATIEHLSFGRRSQQADMYAARERIVDVLFPGTLPVMTKATKHKPSTPGACQRYAISGKGANATIRICGYNLNGKLYDRTFGVGDIIEVDSYNLSYTGRILSIGKTVRARCDHRHKDDMLSIYEFSWRNYDLNLEDIARRNADTMQHI